MIQIPTVDFSDQQKGQLLEWANWLETTELEQGHFALAVNENYCCLGIYARKKHPEAWSIYGFATPEGTDAQPSPELHGSRIAYLLVGEEIFSARLPPTFARELGIDKEAFRDVGSVIKSVSIQSVFINMNDLLHYTFAQIAQEIRGLVATGHFSEVIKVHAPEWLMYHDR